jgi:hypothetical protein
LGFNFTFGPPLIIEIFTNHILKQASGIKALSEEKMGGLFSRNQLSFPRPSDVSRHSMRNNLIEDRPIRLSRKQCEQRRSFAKQPFVLGDGIELPLDVLREIFSKLQAKVFLFFSTLHLKKELNY